VNLHEALDRYAQRTTARADIDEVLRIARKRKAIRRLVIDTKRITLNIIAASSGVSAGRLIIDATKVLQADEAIAGNVGVIRAVVGSNGLALFEVAGAAEPTTLGIVASLRDGAIIGRIAVPQDPGNHYFALGFLGSQVMIKRSAATTPGTDRTPVSLLLAEPNALPQEAYRLPAGAQILVCGTTFPVETGCRRAPLSPADRVGLGSSGGSHEGASSQHGC
jgi:hypothetical protein